MAYSYKIVTANGSDTEFSIVFTSEAGIDSKPYLSSGHIKIYLDGSTTALSSGYSIDESSTPKVVFDTAPANGVIIKIARETPKTAGTRLVDFQDGSILTESDLDTSALQNLYVAQEAQDQGTYGLPKNETGTGWDAGALPINNVADPSNTYDSVNKGYVDAIATWGTGTTPQIWELEGTGATNTFTLSSPSPASTINELFVVYVSGIIQAPSSNDAVTTRDYKIVESSGVYSIVFETGAFPDESDTSYPPDDAPIYVQNFGYARNVFDAPLILTAPSATDIPMTLTGFSGQTAKILSIKNSAAAEKASIDNDGNITSAGIVEAARFQTTGLSASADQVRANTLYAASGLTVESGNIVHTVGNIVAQDGDIYATGVGHSIYSANGNIRGDSVCTTGNQADVESGEILGDFITSVGKLTAGAGCDVEGHLTTDTLTTAGNVTVNGDLTVAGGITGGLLACGRIYPDTISSGTIEWKTDPIMFGFEASPEKTDAREIKFTLSNARPDGGSRHYIIVNPHLAAADHKHYANGGGDVKVIAQTANTFTIEVADNEIDHTVFVF